MHIRYPDRWSFAHRYSGCSALNRAQLCPGEPPKFAVSYRARMYTVEHASADGRKDVPTGRNGIHPPTYKHNVCRRWRENKTQAEHVMIVHRGKSVAATWRTRRPNAFETNGTVDGRVALVNGRPSIGPWLMTIKLAHQLSFAGDGTGSCLRCICVYIKFTEISIIPASEKN